VVVSSGGQTRTVSCSNSLSVTVEPLPDVVAGAVSPRSTMVGESTTLYGTISNIGNESTGRSFTSTFKIDNDANHSLLYSSRQVTTPTVSAGSNRSIQTNVTFPSPGVWYTQLCADQNASANGVIDESNEKNNCGAWVQVTVDALPTPTATLSAVPSSIDNGQSSLLSWSSTNTTACVGNNFSTGGATSGSEVVSPVSNTTYTLTCNGVGGSAQDIKTVTVVNKPDLSVSSVTPSSATAEEPVALRTTVSNSGSITTGSSFTNTFFIDNNSSHGSVYATQSRTMSALNVGQSRTAEASFTFPTAGTWYVRACADQNALGTGTISEFNESNNCSSWRTVTVAQPVPPTPEAEISISASPETVSPQETATISWSVEHVAGSCSVSGTNGQNFTARAPSGSRETIVIDARVTYTLSCTDLFGEQQTASVTVNLVPEFQEI